MIETITTRVLYQFLQIKQAGLSVERCLTDMGIKTVMIYGMGYIGDRLITELEGTSIKIAGVIDIHADQKDCDHKLFFPEDEFPQIDAIIITPIYLFDSLSEYYKNRGILSISIEDVFYAMLEAE